MNPKHISPGAAAFAALRRQTLNRALRDVVDDCLPQLTPVDGGLPISRNDKTNPKPTARPVLTPGQSATYSRSAAPDRSTTCTAPPISVDARLPQLTPVDTRLPNSRNDKTNPPNHPGAVLHPRQLAAARMIAQGFKPVDVATALKLTRQGLWKWRRSPAFAAEVARLHQLLIARRGIQNSPPEWR